MKRLGVILAVFVLTLLHAAPGVAATIYACKKKIGGTIRIVAAATVCAATEVKKSWPDAAEVTALKQRLAALESLLQHFSRNGNDISITGANLWVKDGSGSTDGAVNGLGNLIVGYNELRGGGDNRTGSHNIIVGGRNNYSSVGGLVVGFWNTLSGGYAAVSGGAFNTASGDGSSVSGGGGNSASGDYSTVGGGWSNTASGESSTVSGGLLDSVTGNYDWRAGEYFQDE